MGSVGDRLHADEVGTLNVWPASHRSGRPGIILEINKPNAKFAALDSPQQVMQVVAAIMRIAVDTFGVEALQRAGQPGDVEVLPVLLPPDEKH